MQLGEHEKSISNIWYSRDASSQNYNILLLVYNRCNLHFTFSYLADAFIQSDLQMRTMEAI